MPASSKNRLRVAVVGAGLGSAPHFKSLEDLADQVELVWIYSRSNERLSGLKMPANTRKTTRLEDILEDSSIAAVLVLTPPHTHLDVVRQVAKTGKHVLVEKPLEIDLIRATALVDACDAAGVTLGIMLQHRLREAALHLARLTSSGELGSLVSACASVRWWRPQSYYDVPGRGTLARDGGGVLMTQAIHTLDLLISLTGMPERITGLASTSAVHSMACEDTAAALLYWPSGAIGVVHATTAAYPGFSERIELNFTQGTATLASGVLQVAWIDGTSLTIGAAQASGGGADPMAFNHDAHREVLQNFFTALQNKTEPLVTGRSALAVQRMIEAIMHSSKQRDTVWLGASA